MANDLVTQEKKHLLAEVDSYDEFVKRRSEIAEESGQQEGLGNFLPRLRVNYAPEFFPEDDDADPITLPRGQYAINFTKEDGTVVDVFSKTAIFHIYVKGYRYNVYDNENNKMELSSVIFDNWGDPVFDDQGNEFVAKTYKTKMIKANPQYDDNLKCSHVLYGTVTMKDAKDMYGNKHKVEDYPCMFNIKGSSFMTFADALKDQKDKGKYMFDHKMKLGTRKEPVSKTVTVFPITIAWLNDESAITDENFKAFQELHQKFEDTKDAENSIVMSKYAKAVAKAEGPSEGTDPKLIEHEVLDDGLPDDMVA